MNPLPIDESLPRLIAALESAPAVILSAPPGAGKTTRVPLALLGAPWAGGKKVLMLEPRRLAARRSAAFMASLLGERIGETVGYRIRGEAVVGPRTRVEVVTEGILTRLLHAAPDLPRVAVVVFDEFHERSIHADLGLALALDVQEHLRADLRLLVMSATLDGVSLRRVLAGAPVVESAGRTHAVDTLYLKSPYAGPVERETARVIRRALDETAGDVLAFLPGIREIRLVDRILADDRLPEGVSVRMLYGDADPDSQRLALEPGAERRVILATSIAETSLTIDGVRVVVDSGLARVPRFDPRRGMTGLDTVPVSIASADQRRGRAGRQAPGVCYRLWTEDREGTLPRFGTPEILAADLAPLALDLAMWGGGDGLRFIDPPPPAHLAQARELLTRLGAIGDDGRITHLGRAMSDLPVHPRLAHMIIRGKEFSPGPLACDIAAVLEERDILRGAGRDIDVTSRVDALRSGEGADRDLLHRVRAESLRLQKAAGSGRGVTDLSRTGLLVALAYPERIGRRREAASGRYLMAGGTGAVIPGWSPLAKEEFIAVADVDGIGTEAKVFLAAPLSAGDIERGFAGSIIAEEQVFWDASAESVVARRVRRLGAVIVDESTIQPGDRDVRDTMMEGIRLMGLDALPWDREALSLRSRSEWLRARGHVPADWPDLSDRNLRADLPRWLGPFLGNVTRRSHLQKLDMAAILRGMFTRRQWTDLAALAPEALTVPTGSRIRLDYASGDIPVLSVRLQEMFGQTDSPAIAGGRVKVLIHLLSPAGRPLAVTQDLRSFWSNAYREVRKEMRGRYPKHVWPEDPLNAAPTRRTTRRR